MNSRASLACFNLALAIAMGAFGAHALKDRLSSDMMVTYHTASQYHLIIGATLVAISWQKQVPKWFFICGLAGTLLFCGSLYGFAISGVRFLAIITPLGGLTWIVSLLVLAFKLAPMGKSGRNVEQGIGENRSQE